MPKEIHEELEKQAKRKGLKGDAKNAYVYGTLDKIEKATLAKYGKNGPTYFFASPRHTERLKPVAKPGDKRDEHFLYVSTDKQEALDQGLESMIKSMLKVDRYVSRGASVTVYLAGTKVPEMSIFDDKVLYLYKIKNDKADGWTKAMGVKSGYKTDHSISKAIAGTEEVKVKNWLRSKHIVFVPKQTGKVSKESEGVSISTESLYSQWNPRTG